MHDSDDQTQAHVFQKYYDGSDPQWGDSSGPGSDPFYTIDYRSLVSKFIRLNVINSVVDVGCGDWQFSRFIDFAGAGYVGFDVVESIVHRNTAQYATTMVEFRVMPADLADVPQGDLLIMKDVLQHLSNENIHLFHKLVFPKFKHCLLTNSFRKIETSQNTDVQAGDFRCIDLTKPPFDFRGTYLLEFGSTVWERIRVFHYTAQSIA